MRYLVIPPHQSIVIGGVSHAYGIAELNAEFVITRPVWRETAEAVELLAEVLRMSQAQPGAVFAMTDAAFELYAPLATMRGEPIRNPGVVAELTTLMRAILRATSEPP